jgi:DNA-directed RNA polymerase specialized sigma24 family protein
MQTVERKMKREDLVEEIFNTLHQWPDLERKIFARAHYCGQSLDTISQSLRLDTKAVSTILKRCDRQLQASLRRFRESSRENPSLTPAKAAGVAASP